MGEAVGTVSALWRFPVKSMGGETLAAAELAETGVVGDSAYALIDRETGRVMSAKTPGLGANLIGCRAAFVEAPGRGDEAPPVRITFPDGTSVTSDSPTADTTFSDFLARAVALERAAPLDFTSKLGSAFFAELGVPSPIPVGAFFDAFPVSVLTTSTLDRLNELRPGRSLQIGNGVRLAVARRVSGVNGSVTEASYRRLRRRRRFARVAT
jgi:uncharacterized protein YcbX